VQARRRAADALYASVCTIRRLVAELVVTGDSDAMRWAEDAVSQAGALLASVSDEAGAATALSSPPSLLHAHWFLRHPAHDGVRVRSGRRD